LPKLGIVRYSE